jgi:hypothetical protein
MYRTSSFPIGQCSCQATKQLKRDGATSMKGIAGGYSTTYTPSCMPNLIVSFIPYPERYHPAFGQVERGSLDPHALDSSGDWQPL